MATYDATGRYVSTTVYIEKESIKKLRDLAHDQGTTLKFLLNDIINEYLAELEE